MYNIEDYYFQAKEGLFVRENERLIIESGDLYYCCRFAANIKGANIKALQDVILKSKDIRYYLLFAEQVNSNDIAFEELQNFIIDSKECKYCYKFARDVKWSDKQKLSQVILESLDEYWIKTFYEFIDFDKTEYDKYLMFM